MRFAEVLLESSSVEIGNVVAAADLCLVTRELQGTVHSLEQGRLPVRDTVDGDLAFAGIYLTPVSRELGYASQISNGEYKAWLPLILLDAKALEDFPLRLVIGVATVNASFSAIPHAGK